MNHEPTNARQGWRLRRPTWALTLAVAILSGCAGGVHDDAAGDEPSSAGEPARSGLGLAAPAAILQVRQINRAALRPRVLLDGVNTVPMRRETDARWSGEVRVEPNAGYALSVLWIETVGGRDLPLAQYSTTFDSGDEGVSLAFDNGEYDVRLDFDADGLTNLEERRDGTDPFVADIDIGTDTDPDTDNDTDIDVPDDVRLLIPRIGERGAPNIDGLGVEFDERGRLVGEWAAAARTQRDGTPLTIDKLMVDRKAEGANGSPYRRWAAMHDDEWLYVLVIVDDNGEREGDSGFQYDDDSLELFIDGDNSKNPSWGDNDDFHFILPMLPLNAASTTSNTSTDGRSSRGVFSSRRRVDLDFVTGPGTGPDGLRRPLYRQDVYELRLGLARANIEPGRAFGIELQINDDDDGNTRDSKWGWFHPARENIDIDLTFTDPSVMSTAILLP